MKDLFDLEVFIDKVQKAPGMPQQEIKTNRRTLEVFRLIIDNDTVTPDLLKMCTQEEIEWAFDMLVYWPSYEIGIEQAEDADHVGYQHGEIREIVKLLGKSKSLKRKVAFI